MSVPKCNLPAVQCFDPHYPCRDGIYWWCLFSVSPKISRCSEGRPTAQQLHQSRHSVSSASRGPRAVPCNALTALQRRRHSLDSTAVCREGLASLFPGGDNERKVVSVYVMCQMVSVICCVRDMVVQNGVVVRFGSVSFVSNKGLVYRCRPIGMCVCVCACVRVFLHTQKHTVPLIADRSTATLSERQSASTATSCDSSCCVQGCDERNTLCILLAVIC